MLAHNLYSIFILYFTTDKTYAPPPAMQMIKLNPHYNAGIIYFIKYNS